MRPLRTPTARSLLATLALLVCAACSEEDPTQLVLVVDSDLPVPSALAQVEIAARVEGQERFRQAYDLGQSAELARLPIVLGFVSPDDRPHTVRFEVIGRRAGSTSASVTRSATLQFLPHKILRLDLNLLVRCEGVSCEPGSTCYEDGLCAPEGVDSKRLAPFARGRYPTASMFPPASEDASVDAPVAILDAAAADATPAPVPTCAETCTDGRCYGEVCCRGCWDGTTCRTGQEVAHCGAAGAACATCEDGNVCTQDTCVAGICQRANATGACPDGICVGGQCKCGASGQPCCKTGQACAGGLACTMSAGANVCGPCGAVGQPCCAGDACASGKCSGGMCVACGGSSQPCCGMNTCNAGLACAGGTCACGSVGQPCCGGTMCSQMGSTCSGGACVACGGKDQPCCGTTCGANLSCLQGTCRCGAKGQPCCGGTMCGAGLACNATTKICGCSAGVPDCGGVCRPGWACCPGSTGGSCGQCGTNKCNTSGQWECQDQHGNCNSPGSLICIGGSAGCPCPPGTRQECDQTCNMSGCF